MLDHQPGRVPDLVLADEHEVVQMLPEDLLGQLERDPGREALGHRRHLAVEQRPRLPGPERGGRGVRLDADDLDLRPDRLGDDAGSGSPAAAADRHDDRIDVGTLLEDLERAGADAGDQERLVAGVHVAVAVLDGEALTMLAGLVEVPPVHDQLGAESAHRRELDRVRGLGHADARGDAMETSCIGDRLPVVSRRCRDQPARALILGELGDEVDAATNLEGTDRLVVLVLHPDLGTEQLVEARIGKERCRSQVRADPPARLQHVGKGDRRPVHAVSPVSHLP